jgi:general secretion pathway protein A
MYNSYYGFKHQPFQLLPNPDYLYACSQYTEALNLITDGLAENMGPILLTGEAGTGKTTLIRYMQTQFSSDMQVATISSTDVSSEELLRLILLAFKVNGVDAENISNFDLLHNFLIQKYKEGKQVLLIIDEAQKLSQGALETIRRLSELEDGAAALISIMLVGQPETQVKFDNSKLSSFVQRIAVKYHLTALTYQETREYIAYRLQKAGSKPDLFESEAVELIYRYTAGIPRSINVICNAALLLGIGGELEPIGIPVIKEVIQDRKSLEFPNEGNEEAKPLTADATKDFNDEFRLRLENVEEAVRLLQTQMAWLTAALRGKTEDVKGDMKSETVELFSAQKEHRDSSISDYIRFREKIESLHRPQTAAAKIGRIRKSSIGQPTHLVKGIKRGG